MKERFEKILHNKLYDLQTDRPVPSWNEMQRRMTLSENASGVRPRRSRRLWAYTAVAALIAVMVGFTIFQIDRRQQDAVVDLPTITDNPIFTLPETISEPELFSLEEVLPSTGNTTLSQLMKSAVSVTTVTPSQINPLLQANLEPAVLEGFKIAPLEAETIQLGDVFGPALPPPNNTQSSQGRSNPQTNAQNSETASYGDGFDWDKFTEKQQRQPWVLSAHTGAFASSRATLDRNHALPNFSAMMFGQTISPLPAFQGEDLDHKFPVSVGISVRKHLTRRWALETGLVYTYLEATGEMTGASYRDQYRQQVHYLGIPIYASYSLFYNNRWDIYLNGGFMMEIPVSATSRTRYYNPDGKLYNTSEATLASKGLLWSTTMGAGVNYYMLDNFGVYLEPGASYYFANPNQPYTYHTKHPWSFNLRLGFRVKF